jgi:FkbM family methyltransferase
MNIYIFFIRLKKIFCILTSRRFFFIFLRYGVLPAVEHKPIFKNNFKTIIDIGANRGQFSLACKLWAPQAFVYGFEPLPKPFKIYKRIFKGERNFFVFNSAIGKKSKAQNIHISAKDDSSSLLPIGKNQTNFFPGTHEVSTMKIRVENLDFFITNKKILKPALMKIDVQGYEFFTLLASKSLINNFEFIYCECSYEKLYLGQKLAYEIVDLLARKKFKLIGIYNTNYDKNGKAIQSDFLFQQITN